MKGGSSLCYTEHEIGSRSPKMASFSVRESWLAVAVAGSGVSLRRSLGGALLKNVSTLFISAGGGGDSGRNNGRRAGPAAIHR